MTSSQLVALELGYLPCAVRNHALQTIESYRLAYHWLEATTRRSRSRYHTL